MACIGGMPYLTISSNSRAFVPWRITPASVPRAIRTPPASASRNDCCMRGAMAMAFAATAGGSAPARAIESTV